MGILAPRRQMSQHEQPELQGKDGLPGGFHLSGVSRHLPPRPRRGKDRRPAEVSAGELNPRRGKVAKKYGDDINTDYIIPAYLLQESWDKQFFADHAFEIYDPVFQPNCRANKESIVVALTISDAAARESRRSMR